MQQVLQRAMQHEVASAFFNEPVDPEALGIPEYRDVIQVSRRIACASDHRQGGGHVHRHEPLRSGCVLAERHCAWTSTDV